MRTYPVIDDPAYQLNLEAVPHRLGVCLVIATRWPTARVPDWHHHFSVSLTKDQLRSLRDAIDKELACAS